MRKKFNALQKDIEGQREEIKSLFEQKKVRVGKPHRMAGTHTP